MEAAHQITPLAAKALARQHALTKRAELIRAASKLTRRAETSSDEERSILHEQLDGYCAEIAELDEFIDFGRFQ